MREAPEADDHVAVRIRVAQQVGIAEYAEQFDRAILIGNRLEWYAGDGPPEVIDPGSGTGGGNCVSLGGVTSS